MAEFNEWGIGGIIRMNLDGTGREVFACGIRNSVGMDFTERRDLVVRRQSGRWDGRRHSAGGIEPRAPGRPYINFGFPWSGGGHTRTNEYKDETPPEGLVFPEIETPAHAADLGMIFYTGTNFPAKYRGGFFSPSRVVGPHRANRRAGQFCLAQTRRHRRQGGSFRRRLAQRKGRL
jgi:glucose/arabinose dehydrogenase